MKSPIRSPHTSKPSAQYQWKKPCAVREPVTTDITGPSITANGRMRALPYAMRNPPSVTGRSKPLVMDQGGVGDRKLKSRPGVGLVVPDIGVERAGEIVMCGRDGAPGRQRDLLGVAERHLGMQQLAVVHADHRPVQLVLVPVADAER